jgi:hypothetical protein
VEGDTAVVAVGVETRPGRRSGRRVRLLLRAEAQGIDQRIRRPWPTFQREGDVCASVYAGTRTRILGDDGQRVPTDCIARNGELRRGT